MNIEDFPDFEREAIEERLAHERRVKKDFGKVSVIMRRFFSSKEQRLILKSVFRKRGIDPLKYWELMRAKRLKLLLDKYCHFFFKEDYKTIDYECKEKLTQRQYVCLKTYFKCRSIQKACKEIKGRQDIFLSDLAMVFLNLAADPVYLPLIKLLGEIREWTYDRKKKRS
jgi:hypothetical protein